MSPNINLTKLSFFFDFTVFVMSQQWHIYQVLRCYFSINKDHSFPNNILVAHGKLLNHARTLISVLYSMSSFILHLASYFCTTYWNTTVSSETSSKKHNVTKLFIGYQNKFSCNKMYNFPLSMHFKWKAHKQQFKQSAYEKRRRSRLHGACQFVPRQNYKIVIKCRVVVLCIQSVFY